MWGRRNSRGRDAHSPEVQWTVPCTTYPHETSNSRYYDEGYDAGYDDGEDDAGNGNGWMGQYDNSNRYKGKSRKEYEQGMMKGMRLDMTTITNWLMNKVIGSIFVSEKL